MVVVVVVVVVLVVGATVVVVAVLVVGATVVVVVVPVVRATVTAVGDFEASSLLVNPLTQVTPRATKVKIALWKIIVLAEGLLK